MSGRQRVFVAMSGGVDSAVAAALLIRQGYDCVGIFMMTNDQASAAEQDARQVADTLGIALHVLDLRDSFTSIIDYFCREYQSGRTPNPCVLCNRTIKFGRLWEYARNHGADFLATGHYARIVQRPDEAALYQADSIAKDQSYVLSMIERAILPHILLPMASMTKPQTRRLAESYGLHINQKPDSQEVCFIPQDDHAAFLCRHCPDLHQTGRVIDPSGKVLGTHDGIHRFTIGQRRGLRIALGHPAYVVRIDPITHTVTLGPKEMLLHRRLRASGVNWLIDPPAESFSGITKIRYNHSGCPARIVLRGDPPDEVLVHFEQPVSAITPGQAAVLYIQDNRGLRVAGGGWIDEVIPDA